MVSLGHDDIISLVEQTNGKLNSHDALIALCYKELGVQFILGFDEDFDDVDWLTASLMRTIFQIKTLTNLRTKTTIPVSTLQRTLFRDAFGNQLSEPFPLNVCQL